MNRAKTQTDDGMHAHRRHNPWENLHTTGPVGMMYATFVSKSIQAEYGFFIYLPPSYSQEPYRRYPTLYWLPGRFGNPQAAEPVFRELEKAIQQKKAPEMIFIVPTGPQESMYCDSKDGNLPIETVIVDELVPHVDATYRTLAERRDRAIEGFSMGGFGAAHLGFKYPNLFGGVSMLSAAFHTVEEFQQEHATDVFPNVFGSDIAYCQANIPEILVEQKAEIIRGRTAIRLCIGEHDPLLAKSIRFHDLLRRLNIDHQFIVIRDAKHDVEDFWAKWNSNPYRFYAKIF